MFDIINGFRNCKNDFVRGAHHITATAEERREEEGHGGGLFFLFCLFAFRYLFALSWQVQSSPTWPGAWRESGVRGGARWALLPHPLLARSGGGLQVAMVLMMAMLMLVLMLTLLLM